MGIRLGGTLLTLIRYGLRPLNNSIIRHLNKSGISRNEESIPFWFFASFGQFTNRLEIKLNRIIVGMKGLEEIHALPPQAAFRKGVEWFNEIFFFYGLCFSIVFYQMAASMRASKAMQKRVSGVCDTNRQWEAVSDTDVAKQIEKTKELQLRNRNEIGDLEDKVIKLEK